MSRNYETFHPFQLLRLLVTFKPDQNIAREILDHQLSNGVRAFEEKLPEDYDWGEVEYLHELRVLKDEPSFSRIVEQALDSVPDDGPASTVPFLTALAELSPSVQALLGEYDIDASDLKETANALVDRGWFEDEL